MEALVRMMVPEFEAYASEEMCNRWERFRTDPDELHAVIYAGSALAARFDLNSYADACRCVHIVAAFGHTFPAGTPWAVEILKHTTLLKNPEQFETLWRHALSEPAFASIAATEEKYSNPGPVAL